MPFCNNCGNKVEENASFCNQCGNRLKEAPQKRTVVKCPNCGEPSESFTSCCKLCGYEFRNASSSSSLKIFQEKLAEIDKPKNGSGYQYRYIRQRTNSVDDTKRRKISLISTFPIPNTREDILEFMILASANFDEKYYLSHLSEEDISDAWLSKIKQCYEKARIVLSGEDLIKVEKIYFDTLRKIGEYQEKKKKTLFEKIFKKN